MDKRELILNAMSELIAQDKGACASVSDIAKQAGIGKGSIYYYFKSKEEIFDAVVDRYYSDVISKCGKIVENNKIDAITKLKFILQGYRADTKSPPIDTYLHQQSNAAIHQKSLAKILLSLSPIIAKIIVQGVAENVFVCGYPTETSEIVLSVFSFLLDPGIFAWTDEQITNKLTALAIMLERALSAPKDSFSFLYQNYSL